MADGVHHIRVQNSELRNHHFTALDMSNVNEIEILRTRITGTTHAQGVVVSGTSTHLLFQDVTVENNAGHGLNISSANLSSLTVDRATVRNNTGTGGQAGGAGFTLKNMLVYGNALGIRLTSLGLNARVLHATVADNTGEELQIDSGASATQVTNTIAVGGITNNGTDTVLTTNLTTDPGFVGGGSYKIASGASAAVDAGTDLADVPTDLEGMARPAGATDIGAYDRPAEAQAPAPGALRALPYQTGQFLVLP
jgi:hypothetical protein